MKEKIDISEFGGMLHWCFSNFGSSTYQKRLPRVKIDNMILAKGQFCGGENVITINVKAHRSYLDLCDTFIHEYIHYLQNMENYNMYFEKHRKTYKTHPYEISANNKANLYKKELRKWMKG
jgi:hypothetical protein